MKMFRRFLKGFAIFLLMFIGFLYFNNSSLCMKTDGEAPFSLAHRGMAQTFPMEGITGDACTAERIHEPEHPYLENTIPSMEAAFRAGADIVEFDVQPTTDGRFAVFHDWTLECRTDGVGATREHTMEELKRLDIGYGYTADGGKTYPFRGTGVGLMPALDEVWARFPEQSFLLHVKSNDGEEGVRLAGILSALPAERRERLAVYGGDEPIAELRRLVPDLRTMSMATMKRCLIPYLAVGWTGYVPVACHGTQLHLPEKIAPWLWGFPETFVRRMEEADTRVVLVAGDGAWSEGFDDPQAVERLPKRYRGFVWTNRIDLIGPYLEK
ncbi:glycerophosphodiester phosphodiesterase family protein [Paenibacillus sp.]|uniref:glycerophosphodiester phosphodiesterase family protein n=1 Tax=Paenibacillus sp. TaxID=58172 RepID=UPI002811C0CE|nr:glycerophosphodiester phosphodiesterase family protein [Paenibacillus sp.]